MGVCRYEQALAFHRFWSIDDSVCHSEFSAMRANVVTDAGRNFLLSICEPAPSARRGVSQIQVHSRPCPLLLPVYLSFACSSCVA